MKTERLTRYWLMEDITMSGATPTYHYYIQDHQGNNRVVFNQNGIIEQTNHYHEIY